MTRIPFSVVAVLTILSLPFAAGCSGDPNSSGAAILPDSLIIETRTTTATADTGFLERVRGNQTTLLVGKTPEYEARSLLRFSFPAFDTLARIDSGILKLRVTYRLPEGGGAVEFDVHEMTAAWSSLTFLWDSLTDSFDPTPAGSFSGTVTSADTMVRVRIDTSLLRRWLVAGTGSLMMIPAPGSASVFGFGSHLTAADSIQPVLEVMVTDTSTATLRRNAVSGVFVADGTAPVIPGTILLQSGIAYRSRIMFDSLSLPTGASIAQASFEITADTAVAAASRASRDTLTVSFIQDRAYPIDSIVLSGLCYPVTENGVRLYRGELKTYVQLWATREPNFGILLRPLGELTTLDRIGVYGAASVDSLKPRIRITYSRFP
ncbi:MAG TPA: DNRLRE domain-containing protein [Bacteroidota bacterium]|nr:DNRLRE domain-containing protein [Bacteroidota bacterium]